MLTYITYNNNTFLLRKGSPGFLLKYIYKITNTDIKKTHTTHTEKVPTNISKSSYLTEAHNPTENSPLNATECTLTLCNT